MRIMERRARMEYRGWRRMPGLMERFEGWDGGGAGIKKEEAAEHSYAWRAKSGGEAKEGAAMAAWRSEWEGRRKRNSGDQLRNLPCK